MSNAKSCFNCVNNHNGICSAGVGVCHNFALWQGTTIAPTQTNYLEQYYASCDTVESLRQQLAECKATNGKLREALLQLQLWKDCPDSDKRSEMDLVISNALDLPNDATALNELIAERTASLTAEVERLKEVPPIPEGLSIQIERTDWTPKEALQFYADQRNFDIVSGRARIIDNGAIASNALKHLDIDRLELKGDAELSELRQQNTELTAQRDAAIETLVKTRQALEIANEMKGGPICDTIWMPSLCGETLFDFLDAAIANCKEPGK